MAGIPDPSSTHRVLILPHIKKGSAAVGLWAWGQWTLKASPTAKLPGMRGVRLTPFEVDSLIEAHRESTLNREQSLDLFHQQFAGGPSDARECEPCASAVLDAAGK